ncbi:MAG: TRAP transporter small permease [Thermodesulfobacteriota bacterium]|nr:TRAP transporter small permease [Thermodesulfobacteriota bacterium]
MRVLQRINRFLAKLEGWLIIVLLWLMVVLTFAQVCLRSLYTHGHLHWANSLMGHLDWSEPFVRLLVLWLTFLGASLLTVQGRHIKIDLFSTAIPAKWQRIREFIMAVVSVVISAIMLKACIDYVKIEIEFGGETFLHLPGWIGQLILPAGFALILFRFLLRAIDHGVAIARGLTE